MTTPNRTLPPLLIRASAGTGKTYQLTARLLQILLSGASPDTILATTFTRKAAGEILQRLLLTLANASEDPEALAQLREQIGDPNLESSEPTRLLHWILKEIHRLRICTLDSLFSQLARSFSFELHLPPGWQLIDPIEEAWLTDQAIARMLEDFEQSEMDTLFHMLNKGEAERNVARRLLTVIRNNYACFRRSGRDAWDQIEIPEGPQPKEVTRAIGILESCDVGHKTATPKLRKLAGMAMADSWAEIVKEKPISTVPSCGPGDPITYFKKTLSEDVTEAVRVFYLKGRHEFIKRVKYQTEATGAILECFDRDLTGIKQQTRGFSFDDIAHRLARWIDHREHQNPDQDVDQLASRLDATIDHVLLDEFQDTAPVQWEVLRPFARRTAGSPDRKRTFFCVGDTKQAIYGWRGGESKIFDAVESELPSLDQQSQDTSFRSSPVITDAVTNIFQNLHKHPSFRDSSSPPESSDQYKSSAIHKFEASFQPHTSHHQDRPGLFQVATGPELSGNKSERAAAHFRYVADQIREIASASKGRSIGVLTRTNKAVGQLIYWLGQHGLDVSQEGGNPLVDSAAVELVLSTIRLIENPGDLRWRLHLAHSPLAETLRLSKSVERRVAMSESLQAAAGLRDEYEHAGIANTIRKYCKLLLPVCDASDRLRLQQLITQAHEYQRQMQPRLSAFVDLIEQRRIERPREAQIRVMTIHQAKGLEFDSVVLPELDKSLSMAPQKAVAVAPTATSLATGVMRYVSKDHWHLLEQPWRGACGESVETAMTEALCTLYVALTRPVHALYAYVQQPSKGKLNEKTSSALIYHALGQVDEIRPESILHSFGDPTWYDQLPRPVETIPATVDVAVVDETVVDATVVDPAVADETVIDEAVIDEAVADEAQVAEPVSVPSESNETVAAELVSSEPRSGESSLTQQELRIDIPQRPEKTSKKQRSRKKQSGGQLQQLELFSTS